MGATVSILAVSNASGYAESVSSLSTNNINKARTNITANPCNVNIK